MADQNEENSGEEEAGGGEPVALPEHEVDEASNPENRHREQRRSEQRWQRRFAIYSLVFDGIVAVSAVVGGFFIWQQLVLLRESNVETRESNARILEQMRESNKIATDAFRFSAAEGVVIESVASLGDPQEVGSPAVLVSVRNFGATAATVTVSGDIVFTEWMVDTDALLFGPKVEDPLRPRCGERKKKSFRTMLSEVQAKKIARGQVAGFHIIGGRMTRKQIKAFDSGDLVANVVGCVVARDVAGKIRRTRLCASLILAQANN